jgi:L-alanine-DL-glutamate epimerase-like enolase superfamily enzyme
VVDSVIEVWDRPGLGVTIDPEAARPYLPEGDEGFFD